MVARLWSDWKSPEEKVERALPILRVLEMSYTEHNYKRFLFSEYIHTFKK